MKFLQKTGVNSKEYLIIVSVDLCFYIYEDKYKLITKELDKIPKDTYTYIPISKWIFDNRDSFCDYYRYHNEYFKIDHRNNIIEYYIIERSCIKHDTLMYELYKVVIERKGTRISRKIFDDLKEI